MSCSIILKRLDERRACLEIFETGLRNVFFEKTFIPLEHFEAHMTEDVRELLKQMKTDNALILRGCTKYVQAPDLVWNKPFKGHIIESYDEWLASGVHQYTEAGNMKPDLQHLVVE